MEITQRGLSSHEPLIVQACTSLKLIVQAFNFSPTH